MFNTIDEAIEEARHQRDLSLERSIKGSYWPCHFVVTQFRDRLEVKREDTAGREVAYTTRQDRHGTVNTDGVKV